MGKSSSQTIGYEYSLGMHVGFCHGPIDRITRIRFDKRTAWCGNNFGGRIDVSARDLFGGKKREGGVAGAIDFEPGDLTQTPNDYLTTQLTDGPLPAFRNIAALVFRKFYFGMSPYLKPLEVRASRIFTRTDGLDQWYPAKAQIGPCYYSQADDPEDPWPLPPWGYYVEGTITCASYPEQSLASGNKFLQNGARWYPVEPDRSGWVSAPGGTGSVGSWPGQVSFFCTTYPDDSVAAAQRGGGDEGDAIRCTAEGAVAVMWPGGGGCYIINDDNPHETDTPCNLDVTLCDMNPAHIIREVLTDKAWGMGYPEADIDDVSFTAAADKLYSEQMGISILWDRQQSIQDFLDLIVQHIDATIYVSRETGKFVLKLIRNDYTVGSLLTLGTDEVQGVENFAAPAQGDLISSVSAIYWDSITGEQASVTVHDQALAVQQGAVVGTTSQYPGFTNRRIAAQVAYRDLRALSVPLRSCTVYANRVASSFNPGDVFKLDWPDISADPIIMRVTGIALGDGRTNRVRITCVEDVFSLGDAPIAQDVPSKWQDPAGRPVAPDARLVFEAPYYAIARQEGETVANQFLAAQTTAGWLMTTAKRPGSAINMDVFVDPGTGYVEEYVSDFSPWAVLTAAAGPTDTVLAVGSVADLSDAVVGQLALLGLELVRIDVVTDTAITVGRGCLDTVPASHAIGVNLVLWQDFADIGPTVYDEGEAINVKLLPNSGGAQVAIDLVTADTLTFAQRAYRPYPPGLFKINGEAYPETLIIEDPLAANALSITWAHRDRLQQTGGVIADTTAANIGPEASTTYTTQLIDPSDNSVFNSSTGTTGTTSDFSLNGYTKETIKVLLRSVRSALNSWQDHLWEVNVLPAITNITATGGTITDLNVGGVHYKLHTFSSGGTFEVTSGAGTIEALIVAGGGGGARWNCGGGGGAGGLIREEYIVSVAAYPVTVGLGGAADAGTDSATEAENGGNSSAFGWTAIGGGGGGQGGNSDSIPSASRDGKAGGCGGGGGAWYNSSSGTAPGGAGSQGGSGGSGAYQATTSTRRAGGGGGAGGNGGDWNASGNGFGGVGIEAGITGTLTYYAGGGGGGGNSNTVRGLGGAGGGGNGAGTSAATAGTNGLGGGGGGGSEAGGVAAKGGDGIVIIRYRVPAP